MVYPNGVPALGARPCSYPGPEHISICIRHSTSSIRGGSKGVGVETQESVITRYAVMFMDSRNARQRKIRRYTGDLMHSSNQTSFLPPNIYQARFATSRSLDSLMAKELCLCIHGLINLGFSLDLPESFIIVVYTRYYYILIQEWNPTK